MRRAERRASRASSAPRTALLRSVEGTAVVLITHDLGVVAETAHDVAVMYAGRIVEHGPVGTILERPEHPYTWGLLQSIARLDTPRSERLRPIAGLPPSLIRVPSGCPFHPRCPYAFAICPEEEPPLLPTEDRHTVACHLPIERRRAIWRELLAEHPALRA